MLYDYQFSAAAVAATLVLLTIYLMRRNYRTESNRVFFSMLLVNLAASAVNITTFFTISFPARYPLWFDHLTVYVYLVLYNMMAAQLLIYVSALIGDALFRRRAQIFSCAIVLSEILLIVSSPRTHLIAYFDASPAYRHGPLMPILYIFSLGLVITAEIAFIRRREHFNTYQLTALTGYIVIVLCSIIFQVVFPYTVIENLTCALVLFFLYNAFENPAYYTYKDTRCFNRRAFSTTIEAYSRHKRSFTIFAIWMQDLDYMRNYIGQKGTELLTERIAERLHKYFGKAAYYLSDNIYALIVPSGKSSETAILADIDACFSAPFHMEWSETLMRVATRVIPGEYVADNVEHLDESLEYLMDNPVAREDTVEGIKAAIAKKQRHDEIVHILNRATAQDEFEVFYQPIRETATGRYRTAEALIRLRDEKLGYISPEEFIPIAEEQGKIIVIGEIVFRKVCAFMRQTDLAALGVHYIEINLSPLQCAQSNLAKTLLSVLSENGISPEQINLEITETAQMDADTERTMHENMARLKTAGVTFSIDDFGSGFASAEYLFKFPVSIVKIDKSILWQAMKNESARIVMLSTIRMVKELGKHVVVEGIENDEMAALLTANGCDYMQGYLYSRPVPAAEYVAFLEKNRPASVDTEAVS